MSSTRKIQIALIVVGVGLLAVGGLTLLDDVNPKRYLGLATWLLGALIVHDGIIAPTVFAIVLLFRRASKSVPVVLLLIVQGALVVGSIIVLIVVPEILKKAIGSANATLLPLDYTLNLVLFLAVLAVLTAGAAGAYLALRRQKARSPLTQD
ncbi:hypothetical protein EYE40_08785 [Glaciihabitans arcticus]|uniref:Uncharacterized protein n=1 Tax=Glaciihabitans arcticus TaxID=2668039 RepID=A0A4Q9GRB1_9MICO|nr:hypothetical protein [Glaciihabitans arcticus]TBN57476.1 hypothetical protein EYE40_08785 [Glaciihabitans arcticus]